MRKFLTGSFSPFLQSSVIIAVLLSLIYFFYFGNNGANIFTLLWKFIVITLFTDFLYITIHLFRKPVVHKRVGFDSKKLTVLIICYNGEDIIGKTIENALVHVPPERIIVVSDASTDNTSRAAATYGVKVFRNVINMNKAFSVSSIMHHVKTPYVLILDDDTLIGKTRIPTSLLDDGYDAVAFNVMPIKEKGLFNKLQTFEYRKSMFIGKNLRGEVGAVGCVSGAIGLYRTEDLMYQERRHSGQFGGEDAQRTVLVQIYGKGRGVTYTDSLVETKAPNSFKSLFRQRSFRWNLSLPELFSIYWRILIGTRHHYLLKLEKAYQIFLYSTDPLRALLIWLPLFYPLRLGLIYFFYLFLSLAVWVKLGCKDKLWVVIIFPIYRQAEIMCRLIAHFYWFKIKYAYIFKHHWHRYVSKRKVVPEYATVTLAISIIWAVSLNQFIPQFNNIRREFSGGSHTVQPVNINFSQVTNDVSQYAPVKTDVKTISPVSLRDKN